MMEVFLKTYFWVGVLGFIIRMIELGCTEFPKKKEKTLGEHLFRLVVGIMFTVWAGIALWGN